jgi:ribonuclease HII
MSEKQQLPTKIFNLILKNNMVKSSRNRATASTSKKSTARTKNRKRKTTRCAALSANQQQRRRSSRLAAVNSNNCNDQNNTPSSLIKSTNLLNKLRVKEFNLTKQGYKVIAGVDEAGRGPLCGPVVAACCHIPTNISQPFIEKIGDSKTLNEEQREELYKEITSHPKIIWATGMADNKEIDQVNILQATMLSMHRAVEKMKIKTDYLLIDGNRAPYGHEEAKRPNGTIRKADPPQPKHIKMVEPIIKGDAKCLCIAAASIIAKVTRDHIMEKYDQQYPVYNIKNNKGYPTFEHKKAIFKHGPSPIHRLTFAPLKHMNLKKNVRKYKK